MGLRENAGRGVIIPVLIMALGCASAEIHEPKAVKADIMKAYLSEVTKYDGIDVNEAVILAQSEMIFHGLDKDYYLDTPQLEPTDRDHWGVRFYPINRNPRDVITNPSVLVVVDRKDGKTSWHPQGVSYLFLEDSHQ